MCKKQKEKHYTHTPSRYILQESTYLHISLRIDEIKAAAKKKEKKEII